MNFWKSDLGGEGSFSIQKIILQILDFNQGFYGKKYAIQYVWNFSENSSMTRPLLFIIYYITSENVLIYYIRSKFGEKNIANLRFQRGTPKKLHL